MEAMINPWVTKVTPRLLWQTQAAVWDILGFEHIKGRHADYSPDPKTSRKPPRPCGNSARSQPLTCH